MSGSRSFHVFLHPIFSCSLILTKSVADRQVMTMGALVLRFLAAASALGLARLAESANCYRVDGQIQDLQFGWKACNPAAVAASPCCSAADYCLDNGICLNAGVVNNVFTVQGCTDASWDGDCRKYCAGSIGMCCTVYEIFLVAQC
jgi:hypothetical protein